MLRYLYFRARHGTFLTSPRGIQGMAEAVMSQLVREGIKEASAYEASNRDLEVERTYLLAQVRELRVHTVPAAKLKGLAGRVRFDGIALIGLSLAAFLFYLGLFIRVPLKEQFPGQALGWGTAALLAFTLAFGGILALARLMEALFQKGASKPKRGEALVQAVIWTLLLGGIEAVIVLLCGALHANSPDGPAGLPVYQGVLLVAVLLPLLGGLTYWDLAQGMAEFRPARMRRRMEARIAELDAMLLRNLEARQASFRTNSLDLWSRLHVFRTYKEPYDARKGIAEDLSAHFARCYDTFEQEAERRIQYVSRIQPGRTGDGIAHGWLPVRTHHHDGDETQCGEKVQLSVTAL